MKISPVIVITLTGQWPLLYTSERGSQGSVETGAITNTVYVLWWLRRFSAWWLWCDPWWSGGGMTNGITQTNWLEDPCHRYCMLVDNTHPVRDYVSHFHRYQRAWPGVFVVCTGPGAGYWLLDVTNCWGLNRLQFQWDSWKLEVRNMSYPTYLDIHKAGVSCSVTTENFSRLSPNTKTYIA